MQEAYDRGLRSLQLVHYRVNELGDIQTEPVHGGLTAFGKEACADNHLGILSTCPRRLRCERRVNNTQRSSASNIMETSGWVRFISPEHARLVAGTGGVIGAMPIIFGRRSDDIPGYVHFVSRLVDAAGIDHVGLGTDMDGIGPSGIFTSYARWPSLAAA